MALDQSFADMIVDTLAPLGTVTVRRMFSGGGLFCDGLMFGLMFDETLFLKVDATSKAAFEAEGCGPFVYEGKGKLVSVGYWRLPERLLDEPDEFVEWSRRALDVARRAARDKATRKSSPRATRSTKPRKAAP